MDTCSLNYAGFDSFKGKKRRQTKNLVPDCLAMSTKPSFTKEGHNDFILELHEVVLQM